VFISTLGPATRRRLARLAALLAALGLCELSGCAWIDAKQRELIYRPTSGSVQDWRPVSPADELLWLPIAAGDDSHAATPQGLRAIWIPQADAVAPAVLYLHGTFRNVFQNRPKIAAIHAAGFAVLAVEYRGFGDSSRALPSEASLVEDGDVAWRELARRVADPSRRAIFGHSLGAAVAVDLALRYQSHAPAYGALVLESAFTSLPAIARDSYPWAVFVDALATQHFDSIDKVGRIDVPTWLMAGTADRTVSSAHSRRLYDAAAHPCELVMFEGGTHSRLHQEFSEAYRQVWVDIATQMRSPDAAACGRGASRIVVVDARPGS
jgi:alpha-beta hydrolase superfamily lysophospholipase